MQTERTQDRAPTIHSDTWLIEQPNIARSDKIEMPRLDRRFSAVVRTKDAHNMIEMRFYGGWG
jgi:hypothetical protein